MVPLLTRMRIGERCFWIDLKLEVDVQKWPELKSSERKLKNFLDKERYSEHLMKIEFGIDELKRSGQFTKENVDRLIQDIVLKVKREEYLKREKLGIKPTSVWNLTKRGKLTPVKVNNSTRYRQSEVNDLLNAKNECR